MNKATNTLKADKALLKLLGFVFQFFSNKNIRTKIPLMNLRKSLFYASLLITVLFTGVGCRKLFRSPINAETAYRTKQYDSAARLLTEQYGEEKNPLNKSKIAYKIAECYRLSNQTTAAEVWYGKALEYTEDPEVTFRYAEMMKSNGKYDAANKLFKEYSLQKPTERAKASAQIQASKQAIEWLKTPANYKVRNLQALNSAASDFSPVPYLDDQLVFTSARPEAMGNTYGWTGEKYTDLFVAKRQKNNTFATAVAFGDSINTNYNEGVVSFSPDYKEIYFTACGSPSEKDDFCQIYHTSKNESGKWKLPEPVFLFQSDTINVGQPCLAYGGTQLFFSADAPGGFGDKDLYVVTKQQNGKWTEPKNLGPEINTNGYEGFPNISTDGKLYFASNGHAGMGGLDVFVATLSKDGKWRDVQNLRYPINSSSDDFGLVFEPYLRAELMDSVEQIGYFSSTRPGGKGNDDIYQLILPVPIKVDTPILIPKPIPTPPKKPETAYMLRVSVLQNVLSNPNDPNSPITGSTALPEAIVQVLGLDPESNISKRLVANNKGVIEMPIERAIDYRITASQASYFTKTEQTTTKGKDKLKQNDTVWVQVNMLLEKIYQKKEIVLQNIYYDLDKADIRDDAKPTLNQLARVLKENPNIRIELGSNTDSRGSDKYNLTLSQLRAQSAVNYLVSQGIEAGRMAARGYGETQLTNRCANGVDCTEEEHQQNRRTTFKVIAENYQPN